MVDNSAL